MAAVDLSNIVDDIRELSESHNFDVLKEKLLGYKKNLEEDRSNLDHILSKLDVSKHSYGYFFVLSIKLEGCGSGTNWNLLFVQIRNFLNSCAAEQLTLCGHQSITHLVGRVVSGLIQRRQAIRGILPVAAIIRKMQRTPGDLTPIHSDLAKLCLVAKCFKPILPFLEADGIDILPIKDGCFDPERFLSYFYYGGMICAAIKNFDLALFYFEVVITTPCQILSHLMIAAYKKYLLICLLVRGKYMALPSYTSHLVNNNFKSMCKPYHDFASAYAKNNLSTLVELLSKNREMFMGDSNFGLAKQCVDSFTRRNIQRLTKTFLTLSLPDMAGRVQLDNANEAELSLLRMIEDKDIFASISQRDGMISFHDAPQDLGTNMSLLQDLERNMAQCIKLDQRLQLMNHSLAVNKAYIQKTMKSHSGEFDDISFADGSMN